MNLVNLSLFQTALGSSAFNNASGGMIFNVDDIISPIRKMGRSGSYFYTRADRGRKHNIVQNGYRVLDSLASIKAQSTQIVSLTVTKRHFKTIGPEVMLFDARKIFENIKDLGMLADGTPLGSAFKYEEERENYLIDYEVTDSLASIYAQTQGGGVIGGSWKIDTATITGPPSIMTLSQTPSNPATALLVFKNGQQLNVTADYTIAGNVITFINNLTADVITVFYQY